MKNVKIYDNGGVDNGGTIDRFTAVFTNQPERRPNTFACIAMNSAPFHPQGFGQHSTAMCGKHLGKRISFDKLNKDCQQFILQNVT